jgi:HEPN domain-containing protein
MKKAHDAGLLYVKKAMQDFLAAKTLSENVLIANEIIGFHIQQAIEKGMKALLASHSVNFRKTHDIRELMDLASENSIIIPEKFTIIDEWTPYGVELRYDDIPVGIPTFDRQKVIKDTDEFLSWVKDQIRAD